MNIENHRFKFPNNDSSQERHSRMSLSGIQTYQEKVYERDSHFRGNDGHFAFPKKFILGFLLICLSIGAFNSVVLAVPPARVTDLKAEAGNTPGSVILSWTNITDVDGYTIKYDYNVNLSTTESAWNMARSISDYPLFLNTPPGTSAGVAVQFEINGLVPGVGYRFLMKGFNETGVRETSELSNAATVQTLIAGEGSTDGQGTAAFVPANMPAGEVTITTMTFTVDASSIDTGGAIAMRIPGWWPSPSTFTFSNGMVSISTPGLSAELSLETSAQMVILKVTNGQLVGGDVVKIHYTASVCGWVGQNIPIRVFSKQKEWGVVTEIGSSPSTLMTAGQPSQIGFESGEVLALLNTPVPITMVVRDYCGNEVPISGTDLDVFVRDIRRGYNGTNYFYDADDPIASLSSGTPFIPLTLPATFQIAIGQPQKTFYYRITSNDSYDHDLDLQYQFPSQSYPQWRTIRMRPVSQGITGASVDTGVLNPAQTSVTFTPDFDGTNDSVFINFRGPDILNWRVDLSSVSGTYTPIARSFFGNSQDVRVSWDGFRDGKPGEPHGIAEPATYYVKLSLTGGSMTDTSLKVILDTKGIVGRVFKESSSVPIADTEINIFGTSNQWTRTKSDGTFTAYGLKAGSYQMEIRKTGYDTKRVSFSIVSGVVNQGDIYMTQGNIIKLFVHISSEATKEIWGDVRANSLDWKKDAWGTVHFWPGKKTSDSGNSYDGNPASTFTALTLSSGVPYNIHFNVPGYGIPDFQVTLVSSETHLIVNLTRRVDIFGQVSLPASAAGHSGMRINVEAGPDKDKNGIWDNWDSRYRFWGGIWLDPGVLSETYRVFGVSSGTYLLRAGAPGFVQSSAYAVVMATDVADIQADFPEFPQGGVLTGTITVNGDSTVLDSNDENPSDNKFKLDISVWSPDKGIGSWTQIYLDTHLTRSTGNFSATGLADGVYDFWVYLPGFETVPPGPKRAVVSGGAGSIAVTFNQYTGKIQGTVNLGGATDWTEVTVELISYGYGGESVSTTPAGGIFSFEHLGTNYFGIRAKYNTTGMTVERNVQVVNGRTSQVVLDLSGNTYSISGQVRSLARAPYDVPYIVTKTTPTEYYSSCQSNTPFTLDANRIIAKKLKRHDGGSYYGEDCTNEDRLFDNKSISTGTFDSSGYYTIPKLPPGTYLLSNNGELDNDLENGPEIAEISQLVFITDSDLTGQNFDLIDGYDVSGTIRLSNGDTEDVGRDLDVSLLNKDGEPVAIDSVFLQGSSVDFELERVPPGNYVLKVEDINWPVKYSAKEVGIDVVSANVENKEVILLSAGKIQGQIKISTSATASQGTLVTYSNFSQFIPDNFEINAQANPWFQGGWGEANRPLISQDGYFQIYLNPGTYDVRFRTWGSVGAEGLAQGKKQLVPKTISGIKVTEGQTKDLGIVNLIEGSILSGSVKDTSGTPLPNIRLIAFQTGQRNGRWDNNLETFTNHLGSYTFNGIDRTGIRFYDIIAAPRPSKGDERYSLDPNGPNYGEVLKTQVDTRNISNVDFTLSLAQGSVSGHVTTPDGARLEVPFGDNEENKLGAYILMNKKGTIPQNNPLGDIEDKTEANGDFEVFGLAPGAYDLWVLAKGYSGASVRNIEVGSGNVEIPEEDLVLSTGATLTGKLTKVDGTAPNKNEVDALVAIQNGFGGILVGDIQADAAGTVLGYSIAGFKAGKYYSVLLFNRNGEVFNLVSNLQVNEDLERNFILEEREPEIFTQASKSQGIITIQYEFTRALRNSEIDSDGNGEPDDSECDKIITLLEGAGVLTCDDNNWISSDRTRALVTYTPGPSDTSFRIQVSATFNEIDPSLGTEYVKTSTFTYHVGIGKSKSGRIANGVGGAVQFDDDPSQFVAQPGTFVPESNPSSVGPPSVSSRSKNLIPLASGEDESAGLEVEVTFRAADTVSELESSPSPMRESQAMAVAKKLGLKAYPGEMAGALARAQALDINPFSSFYDIFLPAGVSHFFPEGREAQLCLAYDETVEDPYALNIYYYNSTTNEYVIENENKRVDVDNHRICVSISHASVFTVLESSDSILTGEGYTGELKIINFPNPFNLKAKAVTLQNPGSNSANQTISGTMIKMSIPPALSGDVEIEVFNILGEKVRTLRTNVPSGGAHYYLEWDGKNDHGKDVASGTYIAHFKIGGANERFFKMAVVK